MIVEIVRTEGCLGGNPRIEGTRVGVLHVYELVVASLAERSLSPPERRYEPRRALARHREN